MKFFLRGIMALGLPAILATIASAQNPAPVAPAATAQGPAVVSGGCSTCGGESGSHRRFNRFGRYTAPAGGDRVDHFMTRYDEANHRINGFFEKLAGPEVNPAPRSGCNGKGGLQTQPGTLVFPQHPFIRSPRDFFMQD